MFGSIIGIEHKGPYVSAMISRRGHGPYWANIRHCDQGNEQHGFRFAVPLRADLPSILIGRFRVWDVDDRFGTPGDDIVVETSVATPAPLDDPAAADHDDSCA
eukprot:9152933-Pyramimonas_sp.AAC.1